MPDGAAIRKGAPDAVIAFVQSGRAQFLPSSDSVVEAVASRARRRWWLRRMRASSASSCCEDILKPGMHERFDALRQMGLRTVMITGDNPLTAATIAQAGRRR